MTTSTSNNQTRKARIVHTQGLAGIHEGQIVEVIEADPGNPIPWRIVAGENPGYWVELDGEQEGGFPVVKPIGEPA